MVPEAGVTVLQSQLHYMLQRQGPPSTAATLAPNSLFLDEQYVVSLFQVSGCQVLLT